MTSDPVARYLEQRAAKLDRRARLRPLGFGEIVDLALKTYRLFGWTFLKLTVLPACCCLASFTFLFDYVLPNLGTTSDPNSVSTQLGEVVVGLLLALFVGGPLLLIGMSYTTALVIHLVSSFLVRGEHDEAEAARTARRLLPRLFAVNFRELVISLWGVLAAAALMLLGSWLSTQLRDTPEVGGMLAIIGTLGLVAGAFIAAVVVARHALSPAVAVIEGARPAAASKRSVALMKPFARNEAGYYTVLGLFGLIALLALMMGGGFSLIFELVDVSGHAQSIVGGLPLAGVITSALGILPSFLTAWTILPVWGTTVTILYYDRRIRLEGYDIEALAAEIAPRANRFDL